MQRKRGIILSEKAGHISLLLDNVKRVCELSTIFYTQTKNKHCIDRTKNQEVKQKSKHKNMWATSL